MKLTIAAALALSASGALAQIWVEAGDAPSGVPAHQVTAGLGPLLEIHGTLGMTSPVDHVDTYCFEIVSTTAFYATTKVSAGGLAIDPLGAPFDTRLWIWSMAGGLLVGNDDNAGAPDPFASTVSDASTFALWTGTFGTAGAPAPTAIPGILAPGMYMISISYFPNDPEDAALTDLASLGAPFTGLHGPSPGAGPFDHWESDLSPAAAPAATYEIAFGGAGYCAVPEPATIAALGLGALGLLVSRRRRK